MIYGIDLGSARVKLVGYEEGKKDFIIKRSFETIEFYKNYSHWTDGKLMIDLNKLDLKKGPIISTGYGRYNIQVEHSRMVPEIQAHVNGALFQTGEKDFLLIDLGGQDSKIIKLKAGRIEDFVMNDKCAASAGRFLENMAAQLSLTVDELGKHYLDPEPISSTCAVFSESEVITLLIKGVDMKKIAAGVNFSLFSKIKPMIYRLFTTPIYLAGGAALNEAMAYFIEKEFKSPVKRLNESRFNGAIGCVAYYLKEGG